MRTIRISKRKLVLLGLLAVALIALVATFFGHKDAAVANAEDVQTAASHAIVEALRFDHTEGQEAWSARVRPLCTEAGWSFWNLVGRQMWPQVMETEYTVQDITVESASVLTTTETGATVEVRLQVSYEKSGQVTTENQVYQIVMAQQGDEWLMDAPPQGGGDQ
jgi:hypothetical protein